jgi:hypothetical protein
MVQKIKAILCDFGLLGDFLFLLQVGRGSISGVMSQQNSPTSPHASPARQHIDAATRYCCAVGVGLGDHVYLKRKQ